MTIYNEDSVQLLTDIEGVRLRPGMYIGSTDTPNHLFTEIFDNSIDEYLAGFCDTIIVTLKSDGKTLIVEDNGRGIPIGLNKDLNRPTPEVIFTKLHSGAKFKEKSYNETGESGGLNGLGSTCVNFLSNLFMVDIYRDNKHYHQNFIKGVHKSPIVKDLIQKETGTIITFTPDDTIFKSVQFDSNWLKEKCEYSSYLNKGLTITFIDKDNQKYVYANSGVGKLLEKLFADQKFILPKPVSFDDGTKIAFQYTSDDEEKYYSYANNIYTNEGGFHVTGFRSAYLKIIKEIFEQNKLKCDTFWPNDYRGGLVFVVSAKIPSAKFKGQTKNELISEGADKIVADFLNDNLPNYLNKNQNILKLIYEKIKENEKIRIAVKKTKELNKQISSVSRKDDLLGLKSSGKLTDCVSKDLDINEIWIVEGNSASGTLKDARNRQFQAVYPLRGKVLNASKAKMSAILANEEISGLLKALGCGIQNNYNERKLRYGKIVIACDADVDGLHIQSLLFSLFYIMAPKLIIDGHIYIAHPPLYKVTKGTKIKYVDELKKEDENVSITRFKGLGEMNSEELEIVVNPNTRKLTRITLQDAELAAKNMEMCVGNDIDSRRDLILNSYKGHNDET
jgi:DNA gyrase subunit B